MARGGEGARIVAAMMLTRRRTKTGINFGLIRSLISSILLLMLSKHTYRGYQD